MYFNVLHGEVNQTKMPYWIGVNNMIYVIKNISDELEYIYDNANSVFDNTTFLEQDPLNFYNQLNYLYQKYQGR